MLESYNSIPDENGIYTKTTLYKVNDFLTKKVVETFQKKKITLKVNKNVGKRLQEWKPFGKALDSNNKNVTFIGDDIKIDYKDNNNFNYNSYVDKRNKKFNIFDDLDIMVKKTKENNTMKQEKTNSKYVPIKLFKPSYKNRDKTQTSEISDKNNKVGVNDNNGVYKFKPKITEQNKNSHKKKLFIENLSLDFREDDVADYIRHLGDIKDIYIIRDKYTGVSKGFGFITLYTNKVAQSIIDNFNKKPMGSMIVNIKFAEEKKKRRY